VNKIATYPTETIAKANHDPGCIGVAPHRLDYSSSCQLTEAQKGAAWASTHIAAGCIDKLNPIP
jgi:hypothetical protein